MLILKCVHIPNCTGAKSAHFTMGCTSNNNNNRQKMAVFNVAGYLMSWTGNLVFVYFVVLFVFIIYGGYFLMRVRSREHLGGEFDSILTSCFVVASRCSSAW